MRSGIGTLVFWTLLSLSAVVVNSWGQTPSATPSAAMTAGPVGQPLPLVSRNFPAQAVPHVAASVVPSVNPNSYVPLPPAPPVKQQ